MFRYDAAGQTPSAIESAECKSMEPDVKTSQTLSHVAIVTGGGRGLGRAMVLLGLAQAGIHVVATAARERTEIEAVAEEVRQNCGESRVLPLVADVTQEDDCAEVVDAAVRRFGRLESRQWRLGRSERCGLARPACLARAEIAAPRHGIAAS